MHQKKADRGLPRSHIPYQADLLAMMSYYYEMCPACDTYTLSSPLHLHEEGL